jgi:hypothetical protein
MTVWELGRFDCEAGSFAQHGTPIAKPLGVPPYRRRLRVTNGHDYVRRTSSPSGPVLAAATDWKSVVRYESQTGGMTMTLYDGLLVRRAPSWPQRRTGSPSYVTSHKRVA